MNGGRFGLIIKSSAGEEEVEVWTSEEIVPEDTSGWVSVESTAAGSAAGVESAEEG